MKSARALILLLLFYSSSIAQHQDHKSQSAARLLPGMGMVNHPASTRNQAAQRFFNQGLALVYGFNHEEAAKSFQHSAELDPKLAIAWWGYALAVGFNYNEPVIDPDRMKNALTALETARKLSSGASAEEKALIDALAQRFSPDPKADLRALQVAYSKAMAVVTRDFPEDPDAATLYADSLMNINPWQLWASDGKPAEGTETILKVLEGVLRRHPRHIGANHLYIHALEASPHPELALVSASRLPGLAPAAGHLVHMPGHIYLRTGDYASSASSNVAAANVDRQYLNKPNASDTYAAMYFNHNLDFLVVSYSQMGNYRQARRAARELEENVTKHIQHMPMVENFFVSPLSYLARFSKWDLLLAHPEPPGSPVIRSYWLFLKALAFANKGDVGEARKSRDAFLSLYRSLPPNSSMGLNPASRVLLIAEHLLDARIARAADDKSAAIDALREAVDAQDALSYDEPPDWFYPVRESLGAALLLNGNAAEATAVFKRDLQLNPRNGRSLFGLAKALEKQGRHADAARYYHKFKLAWRFADTTLRLEDL